MTLSKGTSLGPYEILSPLGAGGMGEVYRAKDTRLDREVAVKILPAHLMAGDEAKQRFEREAKVLASLNHPNIATIHGFEAADPRGAAQGPRDDVDKDRSRKGGHAATESINFIVMELVEGETLAQRLTKGPLPLDDVLRVGCEIASALDKAHRAGVVHRDLKPGNIILTRTGSKLLDFGLAKQALGSSSAPDAATKTEPLTSKGTIVGTFQYMAPEQLEGKEADARTDLFAFGAVLYEMATGRRAFEGSSRASLIASIMSSQPRAISELQPMTPPALDHLVRSCLAKDPDDRIQAAHDVRLQLQWIGQDGSQAGPAAPVVARRKIRERFWMVATIVALAAAAVSLVAYVRSAGDAPRLMRAAIPAPQDARFVFTDDAGGPAVISPNGQMIAFAARCGDGVNRLWVRALDASAARVLSGTEKAQLPFWSASSMSLGYFAAEQLLRIDVSGGFPVVLCDAPVGKGGAWASDGTILLAPDFDSPICRLPDTGGTPVAVTRLDETQHTTHRWPEFLPDGKHFLYFAGNHDLSRRKNDAVFFASLDGTVNERVVSSRGNAAFASGHLLYLRNDTLMAQPFDPQRGLLTGRPTPVAQDVQYDGAVWRGVFAASQNGLLIYQTGVAPSGTTLTWFDRTGKSLGNLGEQAIYDNELRLSPDGGRLVTAIGDPSDIWAFDLDRGVRTRLSTEPVEERPVIWSPDGIRIAYISRNRPDKKKILYVKAASGLGAPEPILESDEETVATDWSPDGRFLLVDQAAGADASNIYALSLKGDRVLHPVVATPFTEQGSRFSPDGRWVAYHSDESGRFEAYVVPFCPPSDGDAVSPDCDRTGRWQVSPMGGSRPVWARNGKSLYYEASDLTLTEVSVDGTGDVFHSGAARPLFQPDAAASDLVGRMKRGFGYDVTPDGERFIVNTFGSGDATPLTLVVNWTRLLDAP